MKAEVGTAIRSSIQNNTPSLDGQPDTLQGVLHTAWSLIKAGVRDRSSNFHLPTVASISTEGFPVMQTVVLRGADVKKCVLRIHTYQRSKIFQNSRIILEFPCISMTHR